MYFCLRVGLIVKVFSILLVSMGLSHVATAQKPVSTSAGSTVDGQKNAQSYTQGKEGANQELSDTVISKLYSPFGPFAKYNPTTEIIEKRTGNSKHFRNTDGSLTAVMAAGPMHYLEGGKYKTSSNEVVRITNGAAGISLANIHNQVKTFYGKNQVGFAFDNTNSAAIIYLKPGGIAGLNGQMQEVTTLPFNFTASPLLYKKPNSSVATTVVYTDLINGMVDLEIDQRSSSYKSQYVVKQKPALPSNSQTQFVAFKETLEFPFAVQYRLNEDNGGKLHEFSKNGEVVVQISDAYLFDSHPNTNLENLNIQVVQLADNSFEIRYVVSMAWFNDPARVYPVFVDPFVVLTGGGGSYWTGTTNQSCAAHSTDKMKIGFYDGLNDNQEWATYAKISTAALPDNICINNANFYLFKDVWRDGNGNNGLRFDVGWLNLDPVPSSWCAIRDGIDNMPERYARWDVWGTPGACGGCNGGWDFNEGYTGYYNMNVDYNLFRNRTQLTTGQDYFTIGLDNLLGNLDCWNCFNDETNEIEFRGWSSNERPKIEVTYTDLPSPATFGNNTWNVYGYTNQNWDLNGTIYKGYYTDGNTSLRTTDRYCNTCSPALAPGWQGCDPGADNHTVVAKRQGFPCGNYSLNVSYHDDEARIYVNGAEVWNHAGCCDVHNGVWNGYLGPFSTVEIRYGEGGGGNGVNVDFVLTGASVQGNPANFGANVWNMYAWWAGDAVGGSGAWSSNYSGYYVINALNFDTRQGATYSTAQSWPNSPSEAAGYMGCYVGPDNHSYAAKRQGFPCGFYQINLPYHDDRVMVYVDGGLVYDQSACCLTRTNIWQGFLHSTSTIELRISEGGGGSNGSIELVKLYDLAINSSNAAMNCTDGARASTANVGGGSWSGPGVSGTNFTPANAGVGTHTITYTRSGCTATQQITVTAPGDPNQWGNNSWNVYAYNGGAFNTYYGYYNVNALNINTQDQWGVLLAPSNAAGYQGCTVPVDAHSYKLRRQGFPCGIYNISVINDDNYVLNINGAQVATGTCCFNVFTQVQTGVWLDNTSTIELTIVEGSGGSHGGVTLTKTGDMAITSSNAAMNCSDAARNLTANIASGTFSGPGVSSTSFNPTSAGLGTHTITYTRNGCTATQQIMVGAPGNTATFGNNQWNVYAYNAGNGTGGNGSWSTNYSGYYTISALSFDTRPSQTYSTAQSWANSPSEASGYVGCTVAADNHSWTAKRTNFTCGLYRIVILGHDDIAQLYINGVNVFDMPEHSVSALNPLVYPYTAWMGELSTTSTVEFRGADGGSLSYGAIQIEQINNAALAANVTKTDVTCNGANNGKVNVAITGGVSNARLIRITQKDNQAINLAELQAFDLSGNNIALGSNGSVATSTTTLAGYPASFIIDGNTGNFMHTNSTDGRGQYVQVLLPANAQLDYLRLYNRTDCCQNRSANLLIEVFSDAAGTTRIFGKTVNANATYPTPVTVNMLDMSWSNGATTLSQSNLAPGTYNITVTNNAYCGGGNTTGGATIAQPTDLSLSHSFTNVSCFGSNNGTINLTPTGGTPNRGVNLDGAGDYIDLPDATYFDGGNFTIEAWIYPRAFTDWARVMDFGNGPSSDNVLLTFTSGTNGYPRFDIYRGAGSQGITSSVPTPLNTWTHIAIVYNSGTATMYFNGTQVATGAVHAPQNVVRTITYVGKSNWPEPEANMIIDEFRIWNTAVSAANINTYKCGTSLTGHPNYANLITHLAMNEGSGTTAADKANGLYSGALVGNPTWAASNLVNYGCNAPATGYTYNWSNGATTEDLSGLAAGGYTVTVTDGSGCTKTLTVNIAQPTDIALASSITNESCIGNSNGAINITPTNGTPNRGVSLDGSGDYIDLPDGVYFNGSSFTVEAWVFPRSFNSWSRIFDFANGSGNNNVLLALSNGTSGVPLLDIYNGTSAQALSATQAIQLNTWTHVAVVFNAGTATIYFNGTAVGSGPVLTPTNIVRTNNYIGKSNWPDADANMIVDEFRIWNAAVSPANLNTYKCGTSLVGHPNYANLVTHLAMNEGSGIAVADKANGIYGGTLVGNPTWAASSAVNYGCYTPATGYAYNWSNGATTEDLNGLAAGAYNVTVTDAGGCVKMGSYNVTVTPAIVNTIAGGGPALCNYGDPTSMGNNITGGTGSYTIQWQVSTNGTNYTDINLANGSSYDPGNITQTTWYRRSVVSGPCTEVSNAIQITVSYQTTLTWTGAVSNNWHVDGNWDCGHVPNNTQDVIIPSAPNNQPQILSGNTGVCNSIIVQPGAEVSVKGNGKLDVNR